MIERGEWLRFQLRHGRRKRLPFVLFVFVSFEMYYQLCGLLGYRPRHVFMDSVPESLRAIPPGRQIMLVWPRLPLLIRILERVCPYAYGSHAEFAPYTPEAAREAQTSGGRAQLLRRVKCELRSGGTFR